MHQTFAPGRQWNQICPNTHLFTLLKTNTHALARKSEWRFWNNLYLDLNRFSLLIYGAPSALFDESGSCQTRKQFQRTYNKNWVSGLSWKGLHNNVKEFQHWSSHRSIICLHYGWSPMKWHQPKWLQWPNAVSLIHQPLSHCFTSRTEAQAWLSVGEQ